MYNNTIVADHMRNILLCTPYYARMRIQVLGAINYRASILPARELNAREIMGGVARNLITLNNFIPFSLQIIDRCTT